MSDVENLPVKKLFRIKSESIVDFLKEKVSSRSFIILTLSYNDKN